MDLQYTRFHSLPSELILQILYQLDKFSDIENFTQSDYRIKFIYLDNIAKIKRNIFIRSVPQIKDVFDDEYTLQDVKGIHMRDIYRRLQSDVNLGLAKNSDKWKHILPMEFKIYDLIYRYHVSVKFPVFYQKIKKLKFDKVIDVSNLIFGEYDDGQYAVPYWIKIYDTLKEYETVIHSFIFGSGLPRGYIVSDEDVDHLCRTDISCPLSVYALIMDPNFNPEIQSSDTLLWIMVEIYQLDTDVYRYFVEGLSTNKKIKLEKRIKTRHISVAIKDNSYNDMFIDFIQRI